MLTWLTSTLKQGRRAPATPGIAEKMSKQFLAVFALTLMVGAAVLLINVQTAWAESAPAPWLNLGPDNGVGVGEVAAAPDWRRGGAILTVLLSSDLSTGLARTTDAGTHWAVLPRPASDLVLLNAVPAPGRSSIFFTANNRALFRSADQGDSWEPVLSLRGERAALGVAPDVERSGLLFVIEWGRLFRSDDCGATWALIAPTPPTLARQVVFSPSFEQDQTIFVAGAFAPQAAAQVPTSTEPPG